MNIICLLKNYILKANLIYKLKIFYIYILINIFTKDNRKIYVGIMIVILSFIMYFIDSVSM
jgi:hypothetical protein